VSGRCLWCNSASGNLKEITAASIDRLGHDAGDRQFTVHLEHEEALRAFLVLAARRGRGFVLGVTAISLLMVAIAVVTAMTDLPGLAITSIGVCSAALGLMVFKWPFATPETVGAVGVRGAVFLARALAAGLVAFGIVAVVFLR
jgi:hypothetical protein